MIEREIPASDGRMVHVYDTAPDEGERFPVMLGAAAAGREVRTALEESGFVYDCEFTEADLAVFEGPWGWLGKVAGPALDAGPYGQIDDDVS